MGKTAEKGADTDSEPRREYLSTDRSKARCCSWTSLGVWLSICCAVLLGSDEGQAWLKGEDLSRFWADLAPPSHDFGFTPGAFSADGRFEATDVIWSADFFCTSGPEGMRAARVIEATGAVTRILAQNSTANSVSAIRQCLELTKALYECVETEWSRNGAILLDPSQLDNRRGWWNQPLKNALEKARTHDLDAKDELGCSSLHHAVRLGLTWAVQVLLTEKNVSTSPAAVGICEQTPLHLAAASNSSEIAYSLHLAGANLSAVNCKGELPQQTALVLGYKDLSWKLRTWKECVPGSLTCIAIDDEGHDKL